MTKRKPKTVAEERSAEQAIVAKSPRKKKLAPVADALAEVIEATGLKPATDILRPLEPATLESIETARHKHVRDMDVVETPIPEPLPAVRHPEQEKPEERNGKPHKELPWVGEETKWADRPRLAPPPEGFFGTYSDRVAGIRVSKDTIIEGGEKRGVAAIQFSDQAVPSRAEKDVLEAIHGDDEKKFSYRSDRRRWERKSQPGEPLGDNTLDAVSMAQKIAEERRRDKEAMESVLGR